MSISHHCRARSGCGSSAVLTWRQPRTRRFPRPKSFTRLRLAARRGTARATPACRAVRHDHVIGRHRLPVSRLARRAARRPPRHCRRPPGSRASWRCRCPHSGTRRGRVHLASAAVKRSGSLFGSRPFGQGGERARGGADRILVPAGAQDGEEDRLRIGGADARAVEIVRDQASTLRRNRVQLPIRPLCMNSQRPQAKGWQFGRVIGVPVEARTWPK